MSETDETTAVEQAEAPDAAAEEAQPEAVVETAVEPEVAEPEPEVVAEAEEPEAEVAEEAEAEVSEEPQAATPAAPEAAPIPMPARVAKVFLCERGHRTTVLWSDPTTCQARPFRHAPVCGRQLYPISELPEQVQKALNPLKASKKSSKK